MVIMNDILGNRESIKIIDFFIKNTTNEFSQTMLLKKIDISKPTLIKWIGKLERNKFVHLRKIGPTNLYKLNGENNVIKQIKILNTILTLNPLKKINGEIFVYGSAARGEDRENSDIDLIIIGNSNRRDIIEDIDKLSKKLHKTISFKIFDKLEWSKLARKDKPFYERVEKDKIRI